MKKSLTFEDLKSRVKKPVFVIAITDEFKMKTGWHILFRVNENKNHECLEFTDCHHIYLKNTQFFRFFDTEVSEEELAEILKEEEKSKKKTGYETVEKGEDYFFITSNMKATIEISYHYNSSVDVARVTCANHFNDETLAENIARAERLRYQLRRFAALNGGIPSQKDWQNKRCNKYFIYYACNENKIYSFEINLGRDFGQIYFKSKDACEKAIEIFKYELIWYFTEFEEQLY